MAEGEEPGDVYDILEILRCDVIQCCHVSRPVTFEKLEEWLMQYTNDSVRSKLDNVTISISKSFATVILKGQEGSCHNIFVQQASRSFGFAQDDMV